MDIFMEFYAINVVGALAGVFGSFLQKRGEELADEAHPRRRA